MRLFVCDRLTAAAQEILGAFEKKIENYETELARQRRLLNDVMSPELKLHPTELLKMGVHKEEEEVLLIQQQNQHLDTSTSLNLRRLKRNMRKCALVRKDIRLHSNGRPTPQSPLRLVREVSSLGVWTLTKLKAQQIKIINPAPQVKTCYLDLTRRVLQHQHKAPITSSNLM
ncbi:hypothetical protein EYF80_023206 [Liparis tanakae]|uniref:Uncharacterized protein n=1 Tax=Liparis tanakae TaxID=230148 RepID=A0A4Z2HLS8_9TELE|nr:hypothetical protein EYF80_023206 [Liparis tanakae]